MRTNDFSPTPAGGDGGRRGARELDALLHPAQAFEHPMKVVVDSGSYYWSSERQLEGQDAPYLSVFNCRELPAGEYAVQASVVGANGRVRATARNRILVMSRTPGPLY